MIRHDRQNFWNTNAYMITAVFTERWPIWDHAARLEFMEKTANTFFCDCPALAGLGCKLQRDIWLQDGEATILRKTGSEGVIRLNSASLVLPTEVTVLEACIIKTAHCGAHWAPRKGRCRLLTYTTSALLNRTSRRRLLSPLLTQHGQFHFAFIVNRLKP